VARDPIANPLTAAQLTELRTRVRTELAAIKREIDRAKRAGLDVAELEERWQQYENMRTGILAEYGAGAQPARRRAP
jgi:hypothetical protein